MRVAVLGTGRMGAALGRRLVLAGHHVRVGSRSRERGAACASAIGACAGGSCAEAAAGADAVVLAVPWQALASTVSLLALPPGAVLVDVTNPQLGAGRGGVARATSGAEELQALVPEAHVVKAWNHVSAGLVEQASQFDGLRATVFVAGDEARARELVSRLVRDTGFEAADAGPLASARALEPLAGLFVTLDRRARGETLHALALVERPAGPPGLHRSAGGAVRAPAR